MSDAIPAQVEAWSGSATTDFECASCNFASTLRWFLVFTKPSGERTAQANLERQGYRVYYPRLVRPSLYRGRWIDRVVSLFPRYLFVQLNSQRQSLGPVRSTLGVANLVRFGPDFTIVPEELVEGLMAKADPTSGLHKLADRKPLAPGAKVAVVAGTFESLQGIFEREAGEERVVVLLSLLGRETMVRVPARYVVPADGPASSLHK